MTSSLAHHTKVGLVLDEQDEETLVHLYHERCPQRPIFPASPKILFGMPLYLKQSPLNHAYLPMYALDSTVQGMVPTGKTSRRVAERRRIFGNSSRCSAQQIPGISRPANFLAASPEIFRRHFSAHSLKSKGENPLCDMGLSHARPRPRGRPPTSYPWSTP